MTNLPSGTVTFLFTDIEGSTQLARQHPETWEAARAQHHFILREAIESNHGYVFQIIGDAFCAAFHTAGEALRAAVKSQIDLHSENWVDTPIKVRMGIHTGKAQVQENGEYHGYLAMSRIQRLMSAGHGGQVLISAATHELLREDLPEDISLRDLGERRLKDLIHPERIYQLIIPDMPVDFPPLKTLDLYRHNLPVQLTSFIGRASDIEEIKHAIKAHRFVTLSGVGGTGKTRLALQVAADVFDQFPHGVWFVELAPITNHELIPQTILSAFGIPEQPDRSVLQLLRDYLHEKKLLLVLDNCEHLIQACAGIANSLLSNSPTLSLLATSREALGVPGEMIWHVPSLSLPDVKHLPSLERLSQYEAVQLFIERATLVQTHFQVTNDNAPAIAQICFRLDGIPLAIELAAARVRGLTLDQIARRLDDRFRLLTGGSRIVLERHQTLRAAIDWSYNLLPVDEQLLLCRLSVFVGGWTLEAAEQVCAGNGDISSDDVLDLLTRLVDKSLAILDGSRYRMLETTRQYAREKLLEAEEGESVRDRHLAYFLDLARQADKGIHGPHQINWLARLEIEHDNYRVALDWCVSVQKTESALRLLGALVWPWLIRDHVSETHSWFVKILPLPDVSDYHALYARLLNHMAQQSWNSGDFRYAKSILEESRAIWLKLGIDGERGLAEALNYLGTVALMNEADNKMAQSFFEQSFELYQKHGDQWGMAMTMCDLGSIAFLQGHYAEAEGQYMKSLSKFQEIGDKIRVSIARNELGNLARFQGDYERAGKFHEQNLEIFRELRSPIALASSLFNLAWVRMHTDDYRQAKALLEESLKLSNEISNKLLMTDTLAGFASVLGKTGKPEQAARLFGAVESLLESTRMTGRMDPADQKEFEHYLAHVRGQLDETAFAKLWAEGSAMTIEQAVAYALDERNG